MQLGTRICFSSETNNQTNPFQITTQTGTTSLCNFLQTQFHTFLTQRNAMYIISHILHFGKLQEDVNFEVFTVHIHVAVVWVMTPCSLVGVYQRYEGTSAPTFRFETETLRSSESPERSYQHCYKY